MTRRQLSRSSCIGPHLLAGDVRAASSACGQKALPWKRAGTASDPRAATTTEPSRTMSAKTSFQRSEEHTSELQSRENLVCRLLLDPHLPYSYTLSLHDALPIYEAPVVQEQLHRSTPPCG